MANGIFGNDDAMIRNDMSEDGKRHAVARPVGAGPGFEGCDEGGQQTGKARRQACSAELLGEIETARPDVCNILLQVAHRPYAGLTPAMADPRRGAAARGRPEP